MCAPPFDIPPAQEEEDEVSHFPFQVFGDALFYDSEGEEERESLDKIDPPYYEVEDVERSHQDETMMHALPFNEVIQAIDAPAQQEVNTVSYFPFQNFDDALFYDLEIEEVSEEPFNALNPSCYDKGSDTVDNFDEFIHVGRLKWDVIGLDEDPIYDMEGYLRMLPLQQSYDLPNNFDVWQQDDIITKFFQAPKDDPMQYFPDDFRSYLEDFDEYSFEHLDLFYEEYYQPPLCSDLDKDEDVACPKKDTCNKVFQPPSITLPRYVTKLAVGKYVP
jgi:hypothetical protein